MSSRFVSAGAIDPTTGEAVVATAVEGGPDQDKLDDDRKQPNADEWLAVEKELAAERRRREEARNSAAAAGRERSLFEVLQANKGMFSAFFSCRRPPPHPLPFPVCYTVADKVPGGE